MNLTRNHRRAQGLTWVEVLVVVGTAVLLFGLLLPCVAIHLRLRRCVTPTGRIACVTNLRQVGLAYRLWADDHEDRFPMTVSTNQGGTLELAATREVFRHFQAISNELSSPKIVVCPRDTARVRAPSYSDASFGNSNLSYFVNLDAVAGCPQMILAGDRNLTGGASTNRSLLRLRTNSFAGWTRGVHTNCGNLGLVDGSVQQVAAAGLRRQLQAVTNEFIRLAIPFTRP